jgi:hypothetical protein
MALTNHCEIIMPRKSKFIVNRHTWFLDQFEFSVPCSYQKCLERLQALEAELQDDYDKHANGQGLRPFLKLESDDDASSFEFALTNVLITGTVQQITDETTLFVGLSQFGGAFYLIVIAIVIMALVLAILPFLSAYVMADPNGIWSTNTVNTALSFTKFSLAGILLFYLLFRWYVWRAVNTLVSAFDNCGY